MVKPSKTHTPIHSYTDGPELGHGRIETRTYRIYDGLDMIADKQKWGGNLWFQASNCLGVWRQIAWAFGVRLTGREGR